MPAIVRLEKEVRALFWPWLAVVSLAPLHLLWDLHGYTLFGFFIGVPLIAALSFGHEFHHGTMEQVLSQPAVRVKIWTEKLLVMAVFVAMATAAFWYVWASELSPFAGQACGLYLLTMTASAAYWTLQARSTFGGVTLAWFPIWGLWTAALIFDYYFPGSIVGPVFRGAFSPEEAARLISFLSPLVLAYAGVMLWIGIRKLERFQATGEGTTKDILANLPRVLPEPLRARFRPQAGQPFLNLLRKELRLLRPIWMLALLFVIYEACLFSLGIGFPEDGAKGQRSAIQDVAFIVPIVSIVPLVIVLAGCLPLGEERKWGTHSWHLTLPVSPQRQWLTKLLVGIFTALVCGVFLPVFAIALARYRAGSPPGLPELGIAVKWITLICCATVISFWCACVGHGTVRGAMWVFPVLGIIQLSEKYGVEGAQTIIRGTGSFKDFLVSQFHLDPFAYTGIVYLGPDLWMWLSLPVVALALYQSRKLFRTQPQESMQWMVRRLLPLALLALISGFSAAVVGSSSWYPFPEIAKALVELKVDSGAPRYMGTDDLVRLAPISKNTQRWLGDARISVLSNSQMETYEATLSLANGVDCKLLVKHHEGKIVSWHGLGCRKPGS